MALDLLSDLTRGLGTALEPHIMREQPSLPVRICTYWRHGHERLPVAQTTHPGDAELRLNLSARANAPWVDEVALRYSCGKLTNA